MSQTKFKTTFPVITVIGAKFGLYTIGKFGMKTAKAVQFSSSFLLLWKLPELLHGVLCFSAAPVLFKLRREEQTSIDEELWAFRCTNRKLPAKKKVKALKNIYCTNSVIFNCLCQAGRPVGPAGPADPTTNTTRLSPRYEGKTRGYHCSHWAPDDRRENARNMLSCK
jgi:hypothetical protein